MKRKQGDCDCEETVKRLTSAGTLLPDKHLCQPQQVRAVEFQTTEETSPLLEVPPGVSAVETGTVSTSDAVTGAGDSCILGRTIPYTLPGSHTPACNIVIASQAFVRPASTCISTPSTLSSASAVPTEAILSLDNTITPFTGNEVNSSSLPSYSNSIIDSISGTVYSSSTTTNTDASYSTSFNSSSPFSVPSVSAPKSTGIKTDTHKTLQESLTERQQRLSKRFDALIRAKIIELVTIRGLKKTICPSEVARALSPKAWRDLMPSVRKIGAQLVKEGIILVTQRGTIVDLPTARGPVRFGLAKEDDGV